MYLQQGIQTEREIKEIFWRYSERLDNELGAMDVYRGLEVELKENT